MQPYTLELEPRALINPGVRASGELTTLRIAKDHFFRLMTEVPEMGIEVMKELARRLEKTTADLREARADAA